MVTMRTRLGLGVMPQRSSVAPPPLNGVQIRTPLSELLGNPSGTNISTWTDVSGLHNDMTLATANPFVFFTSGGCDGQPLLCDAADQGNSSQLSNVGYTFDKQNATVAFVADMKLVGVDLYVCAFGGSVFIGVHSQSLQVFAGGVGWQDSGVKAPSNMKVAVVVTFSSTGVKYYVGTVANVTPLSALPAGTVTGVTLPQTVPAYVNLYEFLMYNRPLTVTEVGQLMGYFAATYNTGPEAAAPTAWYVTDGDSTVAGTFCTVGRSWPTYMAPLKNGYRSANVAFPGSLTSDLVSRQYPLRYAGPNSVLMFNIGVNDLNGGTTPAVAWGNVQTYVNAMIVGGYKASNIYLNTLTCASTIGGFRDTFNTDIRNGFAALGINLDDNAADALVGVTPGNVGINHPELMQDGTHWNDLGGAAKAAFDRRVAVNLPC